LLVLSKEHVSPETYAFFPLQKNAEFRDVTEPNVLKDHSALLQLVKIPATPSIVRMEYVVIPSLDVMTSTLALLTLAPKQLMDSSDVNLPHFAKTPTISVTPTPVKLMLLATVSARNQFLHVRNRTDVLKLDAMPAPDASKNFAQRFALMILVPLQCAKKMELVLHPQRTAPLSWSRILLTVPSPDVSPLLEPAICSNEIVLTTPRNSTTAPAKSSDAGTIQRNANDVMKDASLSLLLV